MFPESAFVKMYYFAIEARERVGYTLAALRCEVKIFENQQSAISKWQLAASRKNQNLTTRSKNQFFMGLRGPKALDDKGH